MLRHFHEDNKASLCLKRRDAFSVHLKNTPTVQQYSAEQLTHWLSSNNLTAIHARLLAEGRVAATSLPSVEVLSFIINEQITRLSALDFAAWIERLFDVPLDSRGQYAGELTTVQQVTGKSPSKALADLLREQSESEAGTNSIRDVFSTKTPWWVWLILALALVGALTIAGVFVKKLTN